MIALPHRALHDCAQRFERVGLQARCRRSIESHHRETIRREAGMLDEGSQERALNLMPGFRAVKLRWFILCGIRAASSQ